jgi:hypothetical protein
MQRPPVPRNTRMDSTASSQSHQATARARGASHEARDLEDGVVIRASHKTASVPWNCLDTAVQRARHRATNRPVIVPVVS